jgi:hypothetical protein
MPGLVRDHPAPGRSPGHGPGTGSRRYAAGLRCRPTVPACPPRAARSPCAGPPPPDGLGKVAVRPA